MIRRDTDWQHMPGDYRLAYDALDAERTKGKTRRLWILGLDPGRTTGAALLSVPRDSLLGDEPGRIISSHFWELTGSFRLQVRNACSVALRVTDVHSPCLIVVEDFDLGGNRITGSASQADVIIPVRWGAAMQHAVECGHAGNSVMMFQGRTIAFKTASDDRLRAWGLYSTGSDHKRDATRAAITMIRRLAGRSVDPGEIWADGN